MSRGQPSPSVCCGFTPERIIKCHHPYHTFLSSGVTPTSVGALRAVRAEKVLLMFTLAVHTVIALLVAASPSSFGNATYYLIALAGLVYCNAVHWNR